jgi:hypothetical protein
MLAWISANWASLAVAALAILEIVSVFVPGSSGTLAGLIKVLAGLPGVKDPGIGK